MPEVVLKVAMMCEGCVGAVKRVLESMEGVDSVDVSLEKQTAVIQGSVTAQVAAERVAATGKKTEIIS
ncbi:hypothetical protein BSKO_05385 [Bryopsis sp. KO-2023]|nr:hypothetical protein BSKO_05385 [Bryopsis sp. KO-2023]